jgi:DNA repair protein RecO (recombination protein O)
LQSFQPLLISISGRHELRNLNQLESAGAMLNLTGHQLFCGMYMNELLNRLLPKEMAHPELYVVYQHSLNLLKGGCEIEPCLRQFELLLLEDLGYGIELNVEFENGKVVEPDVDYCLILEQGIQRLDAGSTGSNRFSGEALLQVSDNVWTASSLQCAKRITRISLAHLLGRKPLKSRELFQQSWISKNSSKSENAK